MVLLRNTMRSLCLLIFVLAAVIGRARTPQDDAPTTRIVSLVPSLTEMLFTVGAGKQVAGISDFCMYPEAARSRPRVGGLINPNLERVLALRPDCVLLYRSQGDFAARLNQLGVSTRLLQVDTLADIREASGQLGDLTGRQDAASEFNRQMQTAFQQAEQRAADRQTSVTGIIIVSRDPAELKAMYQAGPGNFLGELFQRAGGTLALPTGAPVSREEIIRANPDFIIDMTQAPDDATTSSAPVRVSPSPAPWSSLTTVRAIRNGNLFYWKNEHALLPGPSVMQSVRQLGNVLELVTQASGPQAASSE